MTFREFEALCRRCNDVRQWLNSRTALVCMVMANMWRNPKRRLFTIDDFMPGGRESKPQTPEQMLRVVKMLNAAHGGKVLGN